MHYQRPHHLQGNPSAAVCDPGQRTQGTGDSKVTWLQFLTDCPTSSKVRNLPRAHPIKIFKLQRTRVGIFTRSLMTPQTFHPTYLKPDSLLALESRRRWEGHWPGSLRTWLYSWPSNVTLGSSITVKDLSFLTNKMIIRIPTTSQWELSRQI